VAHRAHADPPEAADQARRMLLSDEQWLVLGSNAALIADPATQPPPAGLDDLVGAWRVSQQWRRAVEQRQPSRVDSEKHLARVQAVAEDRGDLNGDSASRRERSVAEQSDATGVGRVGEQRERFQRIVQAKGSPQLVSDALET